MRQLHFIRKETLQWREVAEPRIEGPLQALVRPFAVAKCDLDDVFLFHNISTKLRIGNTLGIVDPDFFKIFGRNFFKGPFPFGHECVAEVLEVGEGAREIKVGDVVSVPFQISCGTCINCDRGLTGYCMGTSPVSTYGFGTHLQFGGAMSDKLMIPFADHMLLKIPRGIDPVHLASLSDNVPDAYRNVGYALEEDNNQSVLIIGGVAKSIGLYTVMIARALGATQVDYIDSNTQRLTESLRLGATSAIGSFENLKEQYDIVVDASATEKGLSCAMKSVRAGGLVSSSGIFIRKTRVPLVQMYAKGSDVPHRTCEFKNGCDKSIGTHSAGEA